MEAKDVDIKEKDMYESSGTGDAETDSQIEVLRAAGIGLGENDPTEPVLTLRMWSLAIVFCIVEHVLIHIMPNLSVYVRLGADVLTEQEMFYGYKAGWGFQIMITLATFLFGFCLAGLFRAIVVVPRNLIWPGVLSVTALTTTLHNVSQGEVQASFNTWNMSRYAFFTIAGTVSFCWYWFPDFIFPALSTFNFPCWIAPKNKVVNQLFGMTSGMGLLPITFDWSQISYVGSPLLIPSWAILNVFVSLVFWIWIVAVACYYTNVWNTGYLPFQSSKVFDNTGSTYSASKIVNAASGYKLDVQKYLDYSPIYMPIVYGLNMMGLSFATLSALLVWVSLEHRHVMADAARRIPWVIKESFSRQYQGPQTRRGLLKCQYGVEYWDAELRWYGVLLACVVALVFYPPLALVYATSNLKINIDIFCRIVAGFVFPGKVLANIWFFDIGYISTIKGLYFAQDMKLAYYCHIPQRQLFLVQCVGMVMGTLSSLGVLNWALNHIPGVCTSAASNGFSCPYSTTHFNTSLIWGAIGPRRYFSNQIGYSALLYFFIIGAVLPIPVHFLSRRYPNSLWKKVHIPLFLGGLNYLPPATGMNYGSWAVVGLTFGWLIRKRAFSWWAKYNFVLSSALDSSVGVAGVLIFLTVFFTGASKHFNWWGTEVYKNNCDYKSCAHLSIPEGGSLECDAG
ncbi:hypothetical protein N7513_008777 [Penicillium frequentans]|nr:hypothetical protein N7513_008777 [Penicillium glabrum]